MVCRSPDVEVQNELCLGSTEDLFSSFNAVYYVLAPSVRRCWDAECWWSAISPTALSGVVRTPLIPCAVSR